MFLVILCCEIGSNIFSYHFLKLALHMSWIVIFRTIMNPSMNHIHDKVAYMLCIFKCTLSCGCQRFMIKLSNFCPCVLKFVRQKAKATGNWYLLIMNLLQMFNFDMWWLYWKLLDMGIIGMTFLRRPFSFMLCNFISSSMKSLKLIKNFMGEMHYGIFLSHLQFMGYIFNVFDAYV
jgi:hypothetical protein